MQPKASSTRDLESSSAQLLAES